MPEDFATEGPDASGLWSHSVSTFERGISMTTPAKALSDQAVLLPPEERLALVDGYRFQVLPFALTSVVRGEEIL